MTFLYWLYFVILINTHGQNFWINRIFNTRGIIPNTRKVKIKFLFLDRDPPHSPLRPTSVLKFHRTLYLHFNNFGIFGWLLRIFGRHSNYSKLNFWKKYSTIYFFFFDSTILTLYLNSVCELFGCLNLIFSCRYADRDVDMSIKLKPTLIAKDRYLDALVT